jgi:hypothetical protein
MPESFSAPSLDLNLREQQFWVAKCQSLEMGKRTNEGISAHSTDSGHGNNLGGEGRHICIIG